MMSLGQTVGRVSVAAGTAGDSASNGLHNEFSDLL